MTNINMVWRYKHYIAIIEACDIALSDQWSGEIRRLLNVKRTKAFQRLLDFQIAFHSGD